MAKRRMGIMLFLFCLCLSLLPIGAQAASTADVAEPININESCTLTISYGYETTRFADVPVQLYKVAEVSADFQYALTAPFADSALQLNGIQSQGEWNAVRKTLEGKILSSGITPTATAVTDQNGQVTFSELKPGLYLVPAVYVEQEDLACAFDSALVALPGLGEDGRWQYQVAVICKAEYLPPIGGDEILEWKILKLWKGDSGKKDRPVSVNAEIYRNGILYETVTLSKENDWSYSWSAKKDGSYWMVVERDNTFILTNTRIPDNLNDDNPETGDYGQPVLYLLLMCVSAGALILLAVAGKRKRL